MQTKYTPGPWHLHPSGRANCLGTFTVFYGQGERSDNQICQAEEANARLIAAAPELLAALKRAEAALEDIRTHWTPNARSHQVAAFKKAVEDDHAAISVAIKKATIPQ